MKPGFESRWPRQDTGENLFQRTGEAEAQTFFYMAVSSLGDTPIRATRTKLFHFAVNDPYVIKSFSMSGFS